MKWRSGRRSRHPKLQEQVQPGILGHHLQAEQESIDDCNGRPRRSFQMSHQPIHEVGGPLDGHCAEDLAHAAHVAIDRLPGHPQLGGDIGERGLGHPMAIDAMGGRVKDALLGLIVTRRWLAGPTVIAHSPRLPRAAEPDAQRWLGSLAGWRR